MRDEPFVHRGMADIPGRLHLAIGVVIVIQESQRFRHPGLDVVLCSLEPVHAADVVAPEVQRGIALRDPVGQRLAQPAGALDADGVEPGRNKIVAHLRRLADVELVIRGEAFRAAEELAPADFLQQRHPFHGILEHRHELFFHVPLDFVETEVPGNSVLAPGHGLFLERAHQQAAGVRLVVGALVMVAHHGQVVRQVAELFRDRVVVFACVQRDVDPGFPGQVACPQPGAVHHDIRLDVAVVRGDPRHPSIPNLHVHHGYPLDALRAAPPGALDEGHGHIHGAGIPVMGYPGAP